MATAVALLASGVTTIVELGGTWDGVDLKNAINNGVMVGPRMMVAGPNFAVGGPVNSPETARAAVREWAQHGADWIKLHTDSGACNGPTITLKPDDRRGCTGQQDGHDPAHRGVSFDRAAIGFSFNGTGGSGRSCPDDCV